MLQLKPDKPPPNQILKGRGERLNYYISNRIQKNILKESRTETESENNIKNKFIANGHELNFNDEE